VVRRLSHISGHFQKVRKLPIEIVLPVDASSLDADCGQLLEQYLGNKQVINLVFAVLLSPGWTLPLRVREYIKQIWCCQQLLKWRAETATTQSLSLHGSTPLFPPVSGISVRARGCM
jgi:hypothetical protein